jgi:hypothetical protein
MPILQQNAVYCRLSSSQIKFQQMMALIRAQEREIRMLQRAGIATTAAEILLSRMRANIDDLCRERDALRRKLDGIHANLR